MNAYMYRADLHCEDCGSKIREELAKAGKAPADPDDEHTYDSDEFPKGPYPDGGGESDSPGHCGTCGLFLENPLTEDGSAYVKSAWLDYVVAGSGDLITLIDWREGYPCEFSEFGEAMEEGHYPDVPAVDKLEPVPLTRWELLVERN